MDRRALRATVNGAVDGESAPVPADQLMAASLRFSAPGIPAVTPVLGGNRVWLRLKQEVETSSTMTRLLLGMADHLRCPGSTRGSHGGDVGSRRSTCWEAAGFERRSCARYAELPNSVNERPGKRAPNELRDVTWREFAQVTKPAKPLPTLVMNWSSVRFR